MTKTFSISLNQDEIEIVKQKLGIVEDGELAHKDIKDFLLSLESTNPKDKHIILKNTKLQKEIIKIDIENRRALIHDLHVSPMLAIEIANGEKTLDADVLVFGENLNQRQWEFVYGVMIRYYNSDSQQKFCEICNAVFHDNKTAIGHVLESHKDGVSKAILEAKRYAR